MPRGAAATSIVVLLAVLTASFAFYEASSGQQTPAPSLTPIENLPIPGDDPESEIVLGDTVVDPSTITRHRVVVRGSLANSVWRSITGHYRGVKSEDRADNDPGPDTYAGYLYHLIDRIMQWWIDIETEYHRGDTITFLVSPYHEPDRKWIARIVALSYQGRYGSRRAYYFQETGRDFGAHYDEEGTELAAHFANPPVKQWQEITSLWGDRRDHRGIDFKCPVFTPLFAPISGTLTRVNWRTGSNGNCMELTSEDGEMVMKFLHLEALPPGVVEGLKVQAGSMIGYTGNTGRSSAPHLHFQVELPALLALNGDPEGISSSAVDPYAVLQTCVHQIGPEDAQAFALKKAAYDRLLFPDSP